MQILNYQKVTKNIHTSGQPNSDEFLFIAEAGVDTVVNLAMPDHEKAVANEGALVTSLGMNYIHIPIVWHHPKIEQYELFRAIMQAHTNKSIWVHCALNWRVASFIYLYSIQHLEVSEWQAKAALHNIWTPDETWSAFIKQNA